MDGAARSVGRLAASALVTDRITVLGTNRLLQFGTERDLTVKLLQLFTSADAGGGPDRVVGYGDFLLHTAEVCETFRSHGAPVVGDAGRREYTGMRSCSAAAAWSDRP